MSITKNISYISFAFIILFTAKGFCLGADSDFRHSNLFGACGQIKNITMQDTLYAYPDSSIVDNSNEIDSITGGEIQVVGSNTAPTLVPSQHYFGVRGGIGAYSIEIQPFLEKQMSFGYPEFGIVYRYIGGEKWVGGVAFELNFVNSGYTVLPRQDSDSSFTRTMTSVELPCFWHPQYEFANGKMRIFANAGPYVSYMLSSEYKYEDKFDLTSSYNREGAYRFNDNYDVRLGYGIIGGVGISAVIGSRLELNIEARGKFAFSDVWKNAAKIDINLSPPDLEQMFGNGRYVQTQVWGASVSFGLGYRFLGRDKKVYDKNRGKSKK